MSFSVATDVYSGPFDLLLALISQRRVDICSVPIASLTNDYIAHIEQMATFDLEVTTEFLVVAATLLQLKARALLPAHELDDDLDLFDEHGERDHLIARLLEVRTYLAAGMSIREMLEIGDLYFPAVPASDDPGIRVLPTLADIDPARLAATLVALVTSMQPQTVDLSLIIADEVSADAALEVMERYLGRGSATFREICRGRGISWAVSLFLVMLELAARGEVTLGQSERLGDIEIRKAA